MFWKPSEIVKLSYEDFGIPYDIEGYLYISDGLTHLVDIGSENTNEPHFGILLNSHLLKSLLEKDLPISAGTMVRHAGIIRMKATVTFTGFSILPAKIGYIYNYSFENDYSKYEFHISDTFKDVILKNPVNTTASMLKEIKSGVPIFESTTIMDLKKQLSENNHILLAEHIEGEEFEKIVRILDGHKLDYEIVECPIRFGSP